MAKARSIDMTTGSPVKHLLTFAAPLFLGNIFQQFYNMVDSLVVGKFVGADSLAAIGTCSSLHFLFVSLSMGLANGVGIIVAQYFGAGDNKGIKKTIANAYYLIVSAALIATLIGLVFARPILSLMSTPENIMPEAVLYLRTTVCGIIFIALYNSVAAVLRALGDSKTPLYFLIMSSFLNVGLDLLFVLVLHMGVRGAATATIIAQATSAFVSLTYAIKKVPYYKLEKSEMAPHKDIIFNAFRLGIPMAFQSSLIAISLIVLQGVVNSFGSTVMAAYTISSKVDLIISQLYNAISFSLVTYCGQNYGAGNLKRIKEGYKYGMIIVALYNLILVPVICILSKQISGFFVTDPDVIELGTTALRITGIMYFALGFIYVPRGVLNGCGDAGFSMINGISEVACRIVFSNALTAIAFINVWGIWWAAGLTWFTVAIICNLRYFFGKWKTRIPSPKTIIAKKQNSPM